MLSRIQELQHMAPRSTPFSPSDSFIISFHSLSLIHPSPPLSSLVCISSAGTVDRVQHHHHWKRCVLRGLMLIRGSFSCRLFFDWWILRRWWSPFFLYRRIVGRNVTLLLLICWVTVTQLSTACVGAGVIVCAVQNSACLFWYSIFGRMSNWRRAVCAGIIGFNRCYYVQAGYLSEKFPACVAVTQSACVSVWWLRLTVEQIGWLSEGLLPNEDRCQTFPELAVCWKPRHTPTPSQSNTQTHGDTQALSDSLIFSQLNLHLLGSVPA